MFSEMPKQETAVPYVVRDQANICSTAHPMVCLFGQIWQAALAEKWDYFKISTNCLQTLIKIWL